ncbi:MAG TPA: condensation domain-containing protein, partial [Thermoanaerobaculia bacterium]|nr:condensation domain-containing protein [Thermoanaerobaculia bacterium]
MPDPYGAAGERLYRTGDLARRLAGGEIEYLGRVDQQVKVRGFRIEPGEVEAALASHPGVREAVVVALAEPDGERRLVAYLVAAAAAGVAGAVPPGLAVAELRGWLGERLPEYMVPSAFVWLAALPLTPSGKVDRRALPAPAAARPALDRPYRAPRGAIEETVAAVWADVLGVEQVGADDGFFDLGGHSLLAMRVISRLRLALGVELPLRALFEEPVLSGLAARAARQLRGAAAPAPPPIARAARGLEPLPLSFAQQRLWFLDQLEPGRSTYNMAAALRLEGQLRVPAVAASWNEVVRRHEALRTVFAGGAAPAQVVLAPAPLALPLIDLAPLPAARREAAAARLAAAEAGRPFDLAAGPLLRTALLRLGGEEHVALITLHHIAGDGWSIGVLSAELWTLYGAFSAGRPSPLPELPIQYPDYALWQRRWLEGETLREQLAYWRRQLQSMAEPLELPWDHPRPPQETFRGGTLAFSWPASLMRPLSAFARGAGATLAMALMAIFQTLLGRYSGRRDIAVGMAIAGRNRREIEDLIGFFVNTLVVRAELPDGGGLRRLLGRVREAALGAYAHQELPFERLVEELQPGRTLAHNPLVQVMFGFQNFPFPEIAAHGLRVAPLRREGLDTGTAKFDLTLFTFEEGGLLHGMLEYNRDLFEAVTVQRLLGHLEALLGAGLAAPDAPLAELDLLSEAQRHQALAEWNDTRAAYPAAPGLAALFAEQARRRPAAPAVIFGGEALTYESLNRRANRLAHGLLRLGLAREGRVGLCLERSADLVVAVLAVAKAGGAYVPLDSDLPPERLAVMIADSGLTVLLAHQAKVRDLPLAGIEVVLLDRLDRLDGLDRLDPLDAGDDALARCPDTDPPERADG